MPNFTPWYRREEYALMREILDDGDTLPLSFDEWEREAENNKQQGFHIVPVLVSPDEFFEFCKGKHVACNTANCEQFASSRGAASYSLGL